MRLPWVLFNIADLVEIFFFFQKISQNGRPGRREPPQSTSFEKTKGMH